MLNYPQPKAGTPLLAPNQGSVGEKGETAPGMATAGSATRTKLGPCWGGGEHGFEDLLPLGLQAFGAHRCQSG